MKKNIPKIAFAIAIAAMLAVCGTSAFAGNSTVTAAQIKDDMTVKAFRDYGQTSPTQVKTHIGDLHFTEGGFAGGFPTLETVTKLKDELDFQRATQAYIWAIPLVSYGEWLVAHEETFKAKDGDIVQYKTPQAKQGILTANVTTPYAISFADLTRTGALVFDVPAGSSAGIINDMWQRGIADFGVSGPDGDKGGKFLVLAPGMEVPEGVDEKQYHIVKNPTNVVFFGIRALQADAAEADAMIKKFKIYSYSQRSNPEENKFIEVGNDLAWGQWQPHGMGYWKALKKILDRENINNRDRFMVAMLDSLGFHKGKDFNPDERQQKILKEAAVVGEAMVKGLSFDSPFYDIKTYGETHWDQLLVAAFDDRAEHFDQLFRRSALTYEAVSRGKAYYIEKPGLGQQYRSSYKDSDGQFLLGSKHYTLTMPVNPPAKTFWSVVVYDVNTRTPILNPDWRSAVSSRTGVIADKDGSVTIHFSSELPAGVNKNNWIKTNKGESWFAYLRFYGPTKTYFDESYPLQDIKLVK